MSEPEFPMDVPVFVLVEVLEVRKAKIMDEYVAAIAPQMARFGARNVAAGLKTYKGKSDAINMVISWWPSAQIYTDWQNSDDYAPWAEKRKAAANIHVHFIPDLSGG